MSLLSLEHMNKRGEPGNNQQILEGYNQKYLKREEQMTPGSSTKLEHKLQTT